MSSWRHVQNREVASIVIKEASSFDEKIQEVDCLALEVQELAANQLDGRRD